MAFERITLRKMPDGHVRKVFPFHVSMEGLRTDLMCKEDEDYGVFVKYIFICARRRNVIVIIYIVMSNHAHIAVLAQDRSTAESYQNELKRCYSLYYSRKYKVNKELLRRTNTEVDYLDNDGYVRNALAYIPRNALDAGSRVEDYRWSGYQAMFRSDSFISNTTQVRFMGQKGVRDYLHTHDNLSDVTWRLDSDGEIIPYTACDSAYLEEAFYHDKAFFLRVIGGLNPSEMKTKLLDNHRLMNNDTVFLRIVDDLSQKWFNKPVDQLTPENHARLIPYIKHTHRTTVAQLARCFGLDRDRILSILKQ